MRRTPSILIALLATFAFLGLSACSSDGEGSSSADKADSAADSKSDGKSETKSGSKSDSKAGKSPSLSGDAAEYADAMATAMSTDPDMPLSEEQARCYAARAVDIIGADRIKQTGIEPGTMTSDDSLDYSKMSISEDEGNKIYDQFEACGINLRDTMVKSFSEDGELSPESKACFDEVLTDASLRKLMVGLMVRGEEAMEDGADAADQEIFEQLMGCSFLDMDEDAFAPTN